MQYRLTSPYTGVSSIQTFANDNEAFEKAHAMTDGDLLATVEKLSGNTWLQWDSANEKWVGNREFDHFETKIQCEEFYNSQG